jgi:hypothetical protein
MAGFDSHNRSESIGPNVGGWLPKRDIAPQGHYSIHNNQQAAIGSNGGHIV